MEKLKNLFSLSKDKSKVSDGNLGTFLSKVSIIKQLHFGFGTLLLLIIFSGSIIFYNNYHINNQIEELNQRIIPVVEVNEEISQELNQKENSIYRWQAGLGPLDLEQGRLEDSFKRLEEQIEDPDLVGVIDDLYQSTNELEEEIQNLYSSEANSTARSNILSNISRLNYRIDHLNTRLSNYNWSRLENIADYILYASNQGRAIVIILTLVSLIIGVSIGLLINRGVNNITSNVQDKTFDTSTKIEEVSSSAQDMKKIADEVNDDLTKAVATIQNLAVGNDEVAKASNEVSISIQEVSKRIEQLSSQSEVISQAGHNTYRIIKETNDGIDMVEESINNTVGVIQELDQSIDKISDISDEIMKIADQTNLLALNAAIEAARAGEDGEGFTVVAEEVKDLADESIQATKEVQSIISEVEKASNKVISAMITGDGLKNKSIVDTFAKVKNLFKQVSNNMDDVIESTEVQVTATQEISALSQQISASSEEVAAQTQESLSSTENLTELIEEVNNLNAELYLKIKEQVKKSQEQQSLIEQVIKINQRLS
ncbi:methyl-accepting chemotaxis protein [Natroniella sulfidigena]|uniref:methyl-accepting chemotaxis protein n=1 Tax=Natroniella sulfidigena TaxID=723921 RepID=UPI00200B2A2D|nr:methyl-accepting chemotaxis protein [Natroniella sulfidigena]MCK8816727.1 methyl-accepting chemotaxis protein [Natroniella sulfidigena]